MNFRVKNFLVSMVFPFLFLLFIKVVKFEGFLLYGTLFVGLIIEYFLVFWLYNFNTSPVGFISILLLPVLFFGSFVIVYYYFIVRLNILFELSFMFSFFVLMYYFLSTQNILNLAQFKSISLAQAANTTNNFYTVLSFFISSLAIFLLPNIPNILRFIISTGIFAVILLIFVLLHNIDRLQYAYSIFFYISFIAMISIIYVLNGINTDKVVLISIILSLIFRGILILLHYSSRKILSAFDYFQIFLELAIITFLFNFISK
jgi:hypothetical protein